MDYLFGLRIYNLNVPRLRVGFTCGQKTSGLGLGRDGHQALGELCIYCIYMFAVLSKTMQPAKIIAVLGHGVNFTCRKVQVCMW